MATYPAHGLHLQQRHPNRWLLLAIVAAAALAGVGAWALVDHYTGGTTKATTGSATLASTGVANKYIAALDKLDPSALTPIVAKSAVSIDWAYGSSTFHGAKTLKGNWAGVFAPEVSGDNHWRGSLRAATPKWAAVTWRWRGSTNPLTYEPFKMNGLSILDIENGKIVRETYYWDVPGRNPGDAGTVGRKYATALAAHQFGWGRTLRSLYGRDAIESSVGVAPSTQNVDNLIWGRWAMPSFMPLHASLCCAGPSFRLDNGKMRASWAVVNWVAKDASPGGGKVSGLSILQLNRQGKIIRETMYY
jgi:SnoaL-like domain